MNQSFKFRSDEFDENAEDSGVNKDDGSKYSTDGHVRNIGFILHTGERKFLNYAYLVSGNLTHNNSKLTLQFTSDKIVIEGIRLETLYDDLFFHRPMNLKSEKSRYDDLEENTKPIINKIQAEE